MYLEISHQKSENIALTTYHLRSILLQKFDSILDFMVKIGKMSVCNFCRIKSFTLIWTESILIFLSAIPFPRRPKNPKTDHYNIVIFGGSISSESWKKSFKILQNCLKNIVYFIIFSFFELRSFAMFNQTDKFDKNILYFLRSDLFSTKSFRMF